jgi:hypothetical protein
MPETGAARAKLPPQRVRMSAQLELLSAGPRFEPLYAHHRIQWLNEHFS